MFTMKQAHEQTLLPYETLKFYCNQGLVPNVKRNALLEQFTSFRNTKEPSGTAFALHQMALTTIYSFFITYDIFLPIQ